jgi:hypothetical protein
VRVAWLSLMFVAGCDIVYGLEGRLPPEARPGDEDGDGALDNDDSCPHIKNESATDDDEDGISVDCDPDDADGTTMFRWFALPGGSLEDGFMQKEGVGTIVEDGFVLGDHEQISFIAFDEVNAGTVAIDVGYEIVSNVVEDDREQRWAELGIHSVFRGIENNERGAVCFLGIAQDTEPKPPVLGDAYLETKEDNDQKPSVMFAPPLNGTIGRLYQFRTTSLVSCGATRIGTSTITTSYPVMKLAATTAGIAISADRLAAKLTHIWVAWQPVP